MLDIYATGSWQGECTEPLQNLKQEVIDAAGEPVRRIDRMIQLAVIGACRCAADAQLPADTAVFLASERGDLEVTIKVMRSIFMDHQPPKPLEFINTVSNAACFYVARQLSLSGPSNFVSRQDASFGAALELATAELLHGASQLALVGGLDSAVEPLDEHRERLGYAPGTAMQEYSNWLLLGEPEATVHGTRLGQLVELESLDDAAAADNWLSATEAQQAYRSDSGQTATELSTALLNFLNSADTASLAYAQRNPTGRYTTFLFTRD